MKSPTRDLAAIRAWIGTDKPRALRIAKTLVTMPGFEQRMQQVIDAIEGGAL